MDMFLENYEWSDSTGEERALDQVRPLVVKHAEGALETRPQMGLHPAPGQCFLDLLSVCHVPGFTLRDFYELTIHCCNDPLAGRVLFKPAGELTGSEGVLRPAWRHREQSQDLNPGHEGVNYRSHMPQMHSCSTRSRQSLPCTNPTWEGDPFPELAKHWCQNQT